MPPQPPPSGPGTDSVRLSHVFIRLPAQNARQRQNPTPAPKTKETATADPHATTSLPASTSASTHPPSSYPPPSTPQKKPPPHLPPTPSPTPTKNPLKRPLTTSTSLSSPQIKRPRTRPCTLAPKFSLAYKRADNDSATEPETLSWQELKRAAESVMRQVDWAEVAVDMAGNRRGGVYKGFVRGALQKGIEELVGGEGRGRGRESRIV